MAEPCQWMIQADSSCNAMATSQGSCLKHSLTMLCHSSETDRAILMPYLESMPQINIKPPQILMPLDATGPPFAYSCLHCSYRKMWLCEGWVLNLWKGTMILNLSIWIKVDFCYLRCSNFQTFSSHETLTFSSTSHCWWELISSNDPANRWPFPKPLAGYLWTICGILMWEGTLVENGCSVASGSFQPVHISHGEMDLQRSQANVFSIKMLSTSSLFYVWSQQRHTNNKHGNRHHI